MNFDINRAPRDQFIFSGNISHRYYNSYQSSVTVHVCYIIFDIENEIHFISDDGHINYNINK